MARRNEEGFDIPLIGKISEYYDPGWMPRILFYKFEEWKGTNAVVPYRLTGGGKPPPIERCMHENREIRSIKTALRRYNKRLREKFPDAPCVVIVDEKSKKQVLNDITMDFKILYKEPAQRLDRILL